MISAGEASGDLHGSSLARAAKAMRPSWSFFGLGGDLMAAEGVELRAHIRDTAVMGGTEVLAALPRILRIRSLMLRAMAEERPDCLVLIDSPDFNLRLAKAAKAANVPVVYYIGPTVWAWRPGRLGLMRDLVARRALIFPFEADYYRARGVDCDLVGHPLLDEIPPSFDRAAIRESLGLKAGAPVLALLPGSRAGAAKRLAPPMLAAAGLLLSEFPDLRVVVPRAATLPADLLRELVGAAPEPVKRALAVCDGRSLEVMAISRAGLLASGTSTVEGAILGLPMVVAWRFSALSWLLARLLVKTPFVAMANLVAGREIVPELLQGAANPEAMAARLAPLLRGGEEREAMLQGLAEAARALGGPGASARVVEVVGEAMAAGGGAPSGAPSGAPR
jgi:lipid-A-disaccharide synthase